MAVSVKINNFNSETEIYNEATKGEWSTEYDMHLNDQAINAITFAMKKAFVEADSQTIRKEIPASTPDGVASLLVEHDSRDIIDKLANNLRHLQFRLSEDGLVIMNPPKSIYKQATAKVLDLSAPSNEEKNA